MTDNDITLHLLKKAGSSGVHSFDLNRLVGTTRAAARINDLKNLGYTISSKTEKMGDAIGCRYYLVLEPVVNKKVETKKPIRWVFDNVRNVAIPVYQ